MYLAPVVLPVILISANTIVVALAIFAIPPLLATAFTGMREISASMGDFARNARMKLGHRSAGRIRGAMPPPRNTPPVDRIVSAILSIGKPEA